MVERKPLVLVNGAMEELPDGDGTPSTGNITGWAGVIRTIANETILLIPNIPFAGTINTTTTKCASGTCTATFKINTTSLGGTANAVSSTENIQTHSSDNVFATGDDISITFSNNANCVDLSFTIKATKS